MSIFKNLLDKYNYRDPLKFATGVVPKRTDQGVDYFADKGSPIVAIGNCQILRAATDSGWPGGGIVQYKLTGPGSHKGEQVYVAEFIVPKVKAGDWVKKGSVIAYFTKGPVDGVGIEIGYLKPGTNEPCGTCVPSLADCQPTEAGKAFARWLHQLGRPTLMNPGPGSTYCPCR